MQGLRLESCSGWKGALLLRAWVEKGREEASRNSFAAHALDGCGEPSLPGVSAGDAFRC